MHFLPWKHHIYIIEGIKINCEALVYDKMLIPTLNNAFKQHTVCKKALREMAAAYPP